MSRAQAVEPQPAKPDVFTRRAAIVGRVSDAVTCADMQGVVVQITGMPKDFAAWLESYRIPYGKTWPLLKRRPDRTETAPDGSYVLCDLPAGGYVLTAALPHNGGRYGEKSRNAVVPPAGHASCDITLSPTTVEGTVKWSALPIAPVLMAIVRVVGSGETTETAADGSYRLVAIQPGKRCISVTANGLEPAELEVELATGKVVAQDFLLTPAIVMPANRKER